MMSYIDLLEEIEDDLDVCLELIDVLLPKAGNKKTQKRVLKAVEEQLRIVEGKLNRTKAIKFSRFEQFSIGFIYYEVSKIRKVYKEIMEEMNDD
mgnify:CR=1 FL=1|nr:MAG TPA: hypothetical protein [Herelleviridae sp.]